MDSTKKEQCFIITPIGEDNAPIRRHIDGIIDAAIIPALRDKYEIKAAHHISKPGSITKQVIEAIYNAKLVIANLSERNPNVMYELALRHAVGKPVIMIVDRETTVPSDIVMQRVIIYDNDAKGVLELQAALKKAESEIDFDSKGGPIFDVLGDITRDTNMLKEAAQSNAGTQEPLSYIMQRLDRIESSIHSQSALPASSTKRLMYRFDCDFLADADNREAVHTAFRTRLAAKDCTITAWDIDGNKLWVGVEAPNSYPRNNLGWMLCNILRSMKIECRSWSVEDA